MVINADFKVPLLNCFAHHVKVGIVGSLQSALFPFELKLVIVKVLHPEIESIRDLNFALPLILHWLEIDDVLLLIMDDHRVEETEFP